MIKEHDLVRTLVDKEGFPAGTKGIVVSIYSSGPACEVEVWDENLSDIRLSAVNSKLKISCCGEKVVL